MEKFLTNLYAQTVSVAVRAMLIGGGAALTEATNGVFTSAQANDLVGAGMIVSGLIWSLGEKFLIAAVVKRTGFSL